MKDIDVLMMDGCTEAEARKHLERGTIVFDDFGEHFDDYMTEWNIDPEDRAEYERMINEKIPVEDWGVVEHENNVFYIQYVL